MKTRNQNPEGSVVSGKRQHHGHGSLIFMSGVALAFSTLGLLLSGFLAYQFFELRQEVREVSNTLSQTAAIPPNLASPAQPPVSQAQDPQTEGVAPTPSAAAQAPGSSTSIQPGQFVQLAFNNTARIELLSVKRSQNSGVEEREYVNVKMRVRVVRERSGGGAAYFRSAETIARNPGETAEPYTTYEAVSDQYATMPIFMPLIREGASVDAQVWLRVPEGVNTIDIYMPKTMVFKNVPISG